MSTPRRRTFMASAATRLGWVALTLLLIAAVVLAGHTYEQLRDMREQNERIRAQLMADSISQRIAHAIDIGIPLDSLVGVEALFNQRLAAHAEIQTIALFQGPGKVLWYSERDNQKTKRTSTGTAAEAPVIARGEKIGTVQLTLQETGAGPFARTAAVLLLPTVLLLAALAYLAARFSEGQGLQLRNQAVRLATRAIASGRYDRSIVLPNRRGFDLRAQQLGHAVRGVHETLVRVRRLIASLRQTEPQALRREYLDRLLAEAEGTNRFAEHGLAQVRVVAAESQAFWASLLITLSAVALQGLVISSTYTPMPTDLASMPAAWLPFLFFASAALGGWVVRGQRWPALSILFSACGAIGLAAVVLAADALPDLDETYLQGGLALWCGVFAGAALAACTAVEKLPNRSGFAHAMPRWHAAAVGAWLITTIWFGPALGSVAYTALGDFHGVLALMLPVLCASFVLLRWNEPRSPWRSRVADRAVVSVPQPSGATEPLGGSMWHTLGIASAAGLLSVQGMVASTTDSHLLPTTVLACALGLGLVTGLLAPSRRRRDVAFTLAGALGLNTLLIVLPPSLWWQLMLVFASALLSAYALGSTVACVQRTQLSSPTLILAGGAIGALVAMGIAAANLPLACMGLAATAAVGWTWWRVQRALPAQARKAADAA